LNVASATVAPGATRSVSLTARCEKLDQLDDQGPIQALSAGD
jgi:hypothetical protein